MSILDRYIISRFVRTFLIAFAILFFIFILQAIWTYIGEFAGKDVPTSLIFRFMLYHSPQLVPHVMPITTLLASIMTFGNLAENNEFAAMKSTGISLQRAMRPLIILIFLLSLSTFFFANNVIPYSQFKSYNFRLNLKKKKPALAITEGLFNPIGPMYIKVDKKHGKDDQLLDNISIHRLEKNNECKVVIKSEKGYFDYLEGTKYLQFILNNGNRYEEITRTDLRKRNSYEFAKVFFEKYTMNIDISKADQVDLEQESISNMYRMLNISQLRYNSDSLEQQMVEDAERFGQNMHIRSGVINIDEGFRARDKPSLNEIIKVDTLLGLMDHWRVTQVLDQCLKTIKSQRQQLINKKGEIETKERYINFHKIALHDKYSLGVICFIFFFVGAPLGAIIRKGGIGIPLLFAFIIYLTYYFISLFGKNSAEEGALSPWLGTWIATLVVLPLGIFLTKRATEDKGFFDTGSFTEPIRRFFDKVAGIRADAR